MDSQEKPNQAFYERVLRYQEKSISPEELKQLNQELRESSEHRAGFAQICETSRLILEASSGLPTRKESQDSSPIRLFPISSGWLVQAGIAAILILGLVLTALVWNKGSVGHEPSIVQQESDDWGQFVVKVEEVSSDAVFENANGVRENALLGKGWVRIKKGWVRLKFRSGAVATLEAPTSFGIDSAMRSYLEYGKVSVYAPESARDFVVATRTMEVVDLGTRFELDVDAKSGKSKVEVKEGLVDLHLGSRGTQREIRPLEAGFSAWFDASGSLVEISGAEPKPNQASGVETRLLAHWTFDEIDQDGGIADSASHDLDGWLRGKTLPELVPGVSQGALNFEEHAQVDLSEHLSLLSQVESYTLTGWVRNPGEVLSMIFSLSGETESSRIQLYLSPKCVNYGWQDGPNYDAISGQVDGWEAGRWYHIAAVFQNGIIRLYRDGGLIVSGSLGRRIGTPISSPSSVKNPKHASLGRLHDGTQGERSAPQWFVGQMDDVQLYTGALNQRAIQFLYNHPGETWKTKTETE